MAMASYEDKPFQNGQHQGMGGVKIAQGLQGTSVVTQNKKRFLQEGKNYFEGI